MGLMSSHATMKTTRNATHNAPRLALTRFLGDGSQNDLKEEAHQHLRSHKADAAAAAAAIWNIGAATRRAR